MRKKFLNSNCMAIVPGRTLPLFSLALASQADVMALRQQVRHLARQLSLDESAQTRLAAAICEAALHACAQGRDARAECTIDRTPVPAQLYVRISGADMRQQHEIAAAGELVEYFSATAEGVIFGMALPRAGAADPSPLPSAALMDEMIAQNRELVRSLLQLQHGAAGPLRPETLAQLGHRLRSPLNSALSLTGFLLDRTDGELTQEQEKQVKLIRRCVESLSLLVNDLLAGLSGARPDAETFVP